MIDRSSLRLKEHQQANLDFFRGKARALSLLPYGSGKTPVGVLRIGDLVPPGKALVITTNGTIYKWLRDLRMWGYPDWKIADFTGKRDQRVKAFNAPYNVAVINYEGLRVMIEAIGPRFVKAHSVLIFDEIHRLKNPKADISLDSALIAHPSHADYVYGLTGSPVLEGLLDLFSILRVVNPWMFGEDYEGWVARFFHKVRRETDEGTLSYPRLEPKPGAAEFLRDKLHSISFRREKEEVEVVYPVQHFSDPIVVPLTGHARRLYDGAEQRLRLALKHQVISLVNVYARLEKLCQLTRSWCYDQAKHPLYFPDQVALRAAGDHLEDIRGTGRVVIWAVRPPEMAMLGHLLKRLKMNYNVIHGGVRNTKKRDEMTRLFNTGYLDALICNPRCMGEGLDLQANHSLRYSFRWSAMEWDQPIGRFLRMTSSAEWVNFKDIIIDNTIDLGIVKSVREKLDVGEMVKKSKALPWEGLSAEGILDDAAAAEVARSGA